MVNIVEITASVLLLLTGLVPVLVRNPIDKIKAQFKFASV
jgi:hypothetical protein